MLIQITEKDIQFLVELGQKACKSGFENLHFKDVVNNLSQQVNAKSYDLQMQKLQKLVDDKEKEIIKLKDKKGK